MSEIRRLTRSADSLRTRIFVGATAISVVSLVLLTAVLYWTYRAQMRADIRDRLRDIVSLAALQVDAEGHNTLTDAEQEFNETYSRLRSDLAAVMTAAPELRFLYTLRQKPNGEIVFLVDPAPLQEMAHLMEVYHDAGPTLRTSYTTIEGPVVEEAFYTDRWGTWLTGYAPFYTHDGVKAGLVGADIEAGKVISRERRFLGISMAVFLLTVPFQVLAAWVFSRRVTAAITQAEHGLWESENLYRTLVEGLPDVVMRFDGQGRHLYVSENVTEIANLTADKFLAKTHRQLGYPEEQCLLWEGMIDKVMRSGEPYETEFSFRAEEPVTLDWRLVPECDEQGAVRSVLSLSRDITHRIRAENRLRDSERRYRELFEGSRDGFVMVDAEGRITDANQAYCDMLGYSLDALREMEDFYQITPARWREWEATEIWENRLLKAGYSGIYAKEYIRKDGSVFPVELQSYAVFDEDGALEYLWGVSRDITERMQAEKEQENLRAQLAQAQRMEAIGRLAGGVAHDFNNMLAIILGRSELALERIPEADPVRQELIEIERAAQRSASLTRQLLGFARRQTIVPQVLDLNETLTSMLNMLRRLIGENIVLAWRPGARLWPIRVDPSQVDQVLANLCVNARDAIDGAGQVTIETHNTSIDKAYCSTHPECAPGDYVQLVVSDSGCGMDEETQSHLFEPFFTTKEVGQGTGLGLATLYGIVKQNKGFVDVTSEVGVGTVFRIYWPRHGSHEERTEPQQPAERNKRGHETILLVEDERAILKLGQAMLEQMGYRVLAAATPVEAIAMARAHQGVIHLLMTDVIMPEMNGRDLARRLLALYPDIVCLFTSGYTADVIASHGMLDAGVAFLPKPYTREALAHTVRAVLDGREVLAENRGAVEIDTGIDDDP